MKKVLLGFIRLYQLLLSPYLGLVCRFEPSCSAYAVEAVERHGAWRGLQLTLHRLWCCRPGGGCGYDPVPLAKTDNVEKHS